MVAHPQGIFIGVTDMPGCLSSHSKKETLLLSVMWLVCGYKLTTCTNVFEEATHKLSVVQSTSFHEDFNQSLVSSCTPKSTLPYAQRLSPDSDKIMAESVIKQLTRSNKNIPL